MSNMQLSDIREAIRLKKDEKWFVDFFEITIEDLVSAFADLIEERREELPLELGMEVDVEDYEDRE